MAKDDSNKIILNALFVDLKKDLAASKPASLLLLSTALNIETVFQVADTVSIKSTDDLNRYLNRPPAQRQFDLAVVVCTAEDIENDSYIHLVSKLRDTDCAKIYLACRVAAETTSKHYDTCLRGLGFKRLHIYKPPTAGKSRIVLYYYDIYDYKEIPDWLNNRFWAHPDRWDKTRW